MYLVVSAALLVLFVGALVDIITRDSSQVKHLPKLVWVLLVIFLPFIGSALWFIVGREYASSVDRGTFGDPRRRGETVTQGSGTYGYSQGGKSTEQQLKELDDEIEFHNNQARISRLESELSKRRDEPPLNG